jgi:hypothetical protein
MEEKVRKKEQLRISTFRFFSTVVGMMASPFFLLKSTIRTMRLTRA